LRNNQNHFDSINETRSNLTNSYITRNEENDSYQQANENGRTLDRQKLQNKITYHFNKEKLNKILNRNFDSYKKKSTFGTYSNKNKTSSNPPEFESEYYRVKDQILHFN
jgi:uncharacterized protein YdcH (DUF465 family)